MEQPTITAEDLSAFHALHADFKLLQDAASEKLNLAKLNQANEITIERLGKTVTVQEKELWDEVWALGPACEAGHTLSTKYPEVFELSKVCEEKKNEMKAFAKGKWGIDPVAMSLSDILRLCEALVICKIAQRA